MYFFEDVKTEDSVTGWTDFDLIKAERALEEEALFQIGEAYERASVQYDVLYVGDDGMKVVGDGLCRRMKGSPSETVPFVGYHDLEKEKRTLRVITHSSS